MDLPPAIVVTSPGGDHRAVLRTRGRLRLDLGPLTADLGRAPERARVERGRRRERYTTPSGKRRVHRLDARTLRVGDVRIVAARDGLAFRADRVLYKVPERAATWLQRYRTDYETPYLRRDVEPRDYGLPALVRARGRYALITQSGVARRAVSRLEGEFGDLRVTRPGRLWNVVVPGALRDVVETDLPLSLGRPSRIADPGWIRPGRAAWSWWADRGSGYSPNAQYAAVDAAAANGWEYVTIDAGWDAAWVPDVVAYARERSVRVVLWFDTRKLPDPEATFAQVAAWGVAGVKLDFLLSDRTPAIARMDDLARAAADQRLVVDFHGCTIPRGLQRTWPNVLTVEGVKGAEYWTEAPADPAHNVNLVLTRNVVGGMDYTPVTPSAPGRRTSDAHELALAVAFESGLQHFPDAYTGTALEVLREVPAAWDDTRLLSAEPDDHAVVARRDGGTWWVAGIVAGPARTILLRDPLLRGTARIVTDGSATQRELRGALRVPVGRDGGFVARISR